MTPESSSVLKNDKEFDEFKTNLSKLFSMKIVISNERDYLLKCNNEISNGYKSIFSLLQLYDNLKAMQNFTALNQIQQKLIASFEKYKINVETHLSNVNKFENKYIVAENFKIKLQNENPELWSNFINKKQFQPKSDFQSNLTPNMSNFTSNSSYIPNFAINSSNMQNFNLNLSNMPNFTSKSSNNSNFALNSSNMSNFAINSSNMPNFTSNNSKLSLNSSNIPNVSSNSSVYSNFAINSSNQLNMGRNSSKMPNFASNSSNNSNFDLNLSNMPNFAINSSNQLNMAQNSSKMPNFASNSSNNSNFALNSSNSQNSIQTPSNFTLNAANSFSLSNLSVPPSQMQSTKLINDSNKTPFNAANFEIKSENFEIKKGNENTTNFDNTKIDQFKKNNKNSEKNLEKEENFQNNQKYNEKTEKNEKFNEYFEKSDKINEKNEKNEKLEKEEIPQKNSPQNQIFKRATRSTTRPEDLVKGIEFDESNEARWTDEESLALVRFVKQHKMNFNLCAKDPILSKRHSNPIDCRRRFIFLYKKAKKAALNKLISSKKSTQKGQKKLKKPAAKIKRKGKKLRKSIFLKDDSEESEFGEEESSEEEFSLSKNGKKYKASPGGKRKSNRIVGQQKINYFENNEDLNLLNPEVFKHQIDKVLAKRFVKINEKLKSELEKISQEEDIETLLKNLKNYQSCSLKIPENSEIEIVTETEKIEFDIQFLVKVKDQPYYKSVWLNRLHLEHFFGELSVRTRLNNFEKNRREIEINNHRLWGENVYFDPKMLEVDRVIAAKKSTVDGEEIEMFLVVWLGCGSLKDATWEKRDILSQDCIDKFVAVNSHQNETKEIDNRSFINLTNATPKEKMLHDYQIEGINWMLSNYYQKRNCILADEMGLGKTIQTLIFLQFLRTTLINVGPFLIVVPLSTISNWRRESENWTTLNTVVYYDPKGGKKTREKIRDYEFRYPGSKTIKFNLLITSYEIAVQDCDILQKINWKFLVIDEGHRLKNKDAKLTRKLDLYGINRRLLLTGTPIQNNLTELWNLMNFVQPDTFPFEENFNEKFQNFTSTELKSLQTKINPFVLRRFKSQVQKSIPPKQETIVDIELTTLQKKYYRAIYEKNLKFLAEGCQNNIPRLMNIEIQLRKCCNHPFLINGVEEKELGEDCSWDEYFDKCVNASGKMVFLDKLLPKLSSEGHKVLIFSQMQKVLDILQDYLRHKGYIFERIDGNVVGFERQKAIDRFCSPDSKHFAFLLTTRAGGVGLNLAAADTVILYDSDWNPQLDLQAQARCHRIGQDKPVMVYRLVTKNSYETQMFNRASIKLGLDQAFVTKLDSDEEGNIPDKDLKHLDNMLRYGAYRFLNDENASKKFCEDDIEELLKNNSRVLVHNTQHEPSQGEDNSNCFKMNFESDLADSSIDVNAVDFWEKVLKKDLEDNKLKKVKSNVEEIKALIKSVKNGALKNNKTKSAVMEKVKNIVQFQTQNQKNSKSSSFKSTQTLLKTIISKNSFLSRKERHEIRSFILKLSDFDKNHTKFDKNTAKISKNNTKNEENGKINEKNIKNDKNRIKKRTLSKNSIKNNLKSPKQAKIAKNSQNRSKNTKNNQKILKNEAKNNFKNTKNDLKNGKNSLKNTKNGAKNTKNEKITKKSSKIEELCLRCEKMLNGPILTCKGNCGSFHRKCDEKAQNDFCSNCKAEKVFCRACRKWEPSAALYKFLECNLRDCKRKYHKMCSKKLIEKFRKNYSNYQLENFRCPMHFCSKCRSAGKQLVSCHICLKTCHKECLSKDFVIKTNKWGFCQKCFNDL